MVDPKFVTKFDRSDNELEEFLIFSVCVAGKDAANIARAVDKLLHNLKSIYAICLHPSPLDCIRDLMLDMVEISL